MPKDDDPFHAGDIVGSPAHNLPGGNAEVIDAGAVDGLPAHNPIGATAAILDADSALLALQRTLKKAADEDATQTAALLKRRHVTLSKRAVAAPGAALVEALENTVGPPYEYVELDKRAWGSKSSVTVAADAEFGQLTVKLRAGGHDPASYDSMEFASFDVAFTATVVAPSKGTLQVAAAPSYNGVWWALSSFSRAAGSLELTLSVRHAGSPVGTEFEQHGALPWRDEQLFSADGRTVSDATSLHVDVTKVAALPYLVSVRVQGRVEGSYYPVTRSAETDELARFWGAGGTLKLNLPSIRWRMAP